MFVDESGFLPVPYVAKTWAHLSQTAVLVQQGRRPKFSTTSGVTPTGHLYIPVHENSTRGPMVVAFLRLLLRHSRRRPIMVFWDSRPPVERRS